MFLVMMVMLYGHSLLNKHKPQLLLAQFKSTMVPSILLELTNKMEFIMLVMLLALSLLVHQ